MGKTKGESWEWGNGPRRNYCTFSILFQCRPLYSILSLTLSLSVRRKSTEILDSSELLCKYVLICVCVWKYPRPSLVTQKIYQTFSIQFQLSLSLSLFSIPTIHTYRYFQAKSKKWKEKVCVQRKWREWVSVCESCFFFSKKKFRFEKRLCIWNIKKIENMFHMTVYIHVCIMECYAKKHGVVHYYVMGFCHSYIMYINI